MNTTDNSTGEASSATGDGEIAAMAALDWEAWDGRAEDSKLVPTERDYGSGPAPQLRLCLMVVHKNKPELVKIARSMWGEPSAEPEDQNLFDGFVKHIQSAKAFAEALLTLATTAEARCIAALASVAE